MITTTIIEKIKSVMIGHAVGDALGLSAEFASREELEKAPVTDMEGYGTYPYPAGTWSDDTSMSLAALDSLAKGKIDWDEIMNNFGKWLDGGEYTPSGETFDVGRTCVRAIINYFVNKTEALESGESAEYSNGNGSLMRIHPFVLYMYAKGVLDLEIIHNASALTHAHERSKMACGIYAFVLWELLKSPSRDSIIRGLDRAKDYYKDNPEMRAYYKMLFQRIGLTKIKDYDTFKPAKREDIKSSGYVVDTIEAAIWCLMYTSSYEECVLMAVNLGGDTDTIAAIAGGLAGALYGYDSIPKKWIDILARREYIEEMCEGAAENWI